MSLFEVDRHKTKLTCSNLRMLRQVERSLRISYHILPYAGKSNHTDCAPGRNRTSLLSIFCPITTRWFSHTQQSTPFRNCSVRYCKHTRYGACRKTPNQNTKIICTHFKATCIYGTTKNRTILLLFTRGCELFITPQTQRYMYFTNTSVQLCMRSFSQNLQIRWLVVSSIFIHMMHVLTRSHPPAYLDRSYMPMHVYFALFIG